MGYLGPQTSVVFTVVAVSVWAAAARKVREWSRAATSPISAAFSRLPSG